MDRPTTRFDKHSGKILAGFWIDLILGGLALLEWSLTPKNGRYASIGSISGPGPDRRLSLREWEPGTDYQFPPPPERRLYANGDVRELYELSTDAQGFIEPSVRHEKPDLNIVFMGGSTTECLYVAPENRFPYLASKKLESDLGLKINGINAARAGNDSLHSLLLLVGKVLPLQPDYVVLMEATNDIGPLSHGTYWQIGGSKRIVNVQKISVEESIRILTVSLIPYTSGLVSRAWRRIKGQHTEPEGADAGPAGAERSRQDMGRDFTSVLTSFVHVTRAWGSKPVLMTQVHVKPSSSAEQQSTFLAREQVNGSLVNPETFASDQDYFNAIIRDVAQSEKVMLIELARAADWKFGDVYDSIHFTDQGSKKIADIVAAAFHTELNSGLSAKPPEPR
jgi:lysophospholipase L1-like esterase